MVVAGLTGTDTPITTHTAVLSGKGKGHVQWTRSTAWPKGGKGETRDQFLDWLMWEDSSSYAWTEKGELADLVAGKVRTDLGIAGEGSSRSYDAGGMENNDEV